MNGLLAWKAKNQGLLLKAIKLFNKALEQNPTDTSLLSGRGLCYIDLGLMEDAKRDFDETIRLAPNLTKGYNNRGLTYLIEGKLDLALEEYKICLELDPKDYICLDNMGKVWQELGDVKKANKYHSMSLLIQPYDTYTLCHRSITFVYLGEMEKCMEDLQTARSSAMLDESQYVIWRTEGSIHYLNRKYDEALEIFDKALTICVSVRKKIDIKTRRSLVFYRVLKIDEAIEDLKFALLYLPKQPKFLEMLKAYQSLHWDLYDPYRMDLLNFFSERANYTITFNGVNFKVHNTVLEVRCPVLLERKCIDMHGVSPHCMKHLLEFIYSEKLPNYSEASDVIDLLLILDFLGLKNCTFYDLFVWNSIDNWL
eukprot:TRINITY_DN1217_c0_g1_i4.p1 TRINITY_DN1217_c0_g1~~TRINITY_DN1217_c0_g1_i4.p1  ORF type:complete len:368 (+),score=39.13 TRINITY_DN1217_c0_g1_i4:49-1152(+)